MDQEWYPVSYTHLDVYKRQVKNNEAYTNYYFPKEGETEPSPKRSYTYYYKEFDWVIGTGNYTDDIDKTVAVRHDELTKYSNNMTKIYIAVNGTIGIVLIAIIILIIRCV